MLTPGPTCPNVLGVLASRAFEFAPGLLCLHTTDRALVAHTGFFVKKQNWCRAVYMIREHEAAPITMTCGEQF